MTADRSDPPPLARSGVRGSRLGPLLAGLLGLAFGVLVYGYTGEENPQHRQFRPWLEAKLDPELYTRDPYVRDLERVPGAFWRGSLLVLRATGASPDAWFLGLWAFLLFAAHAAYFLLARRLAGSERAGWLATALAVLSERLHSYSLLSHDNVFRDRADQTLAAWPPLLLGLWAWCGGRRLAGIAALGLAFHLNPFLSAGAAFCVLFAEALEARRRRLPWVPLRLAGAYLLIGAPTWAPVLARPAPELSSAEWAAALRLLFPFHCFPSEWGGSQWLFIALQGGTLAAFFVLGLGRLSGRRDALRLGAGLLALWALSAIFAELVPWRPFILLQGLRTDGLAHLLALAGAAVVLDRLWAGRRWAWFGLVAAALANPHRTLLPLPLLLPVAVHWAARPGRVGRASGWVGPYAAGVALFSLLRLSQGWALSLLYPMLSAALVAGFGFAVVSARARPRLGAWSAAAALALCFGELALAKRAEHARWLSAPEPAQAAARAFGAWLRDRSPKGSLVLASLHFDDLRLVSRRSTVFQRDDGLTMHWVPDRAADWRARMEELEYRFEALGARSRVVSARRFPLMEPPAERLPVLGLWGPAKLAALVRRTGADYVAAPGLYEEPWLAPRLRHGDFALYEVTGEPPPN